jgi:hypothetical protein
MKSASIHKETKTPAPCKGAGLLVAIAVAATALVVFSLAADLLIRKDQGATVAGRWMKSLALSAPALWSAGTPLRHPETVHPGIDLRYTAGMESAR